MDLKFAGVRASQDQGPYHGVEAWMSVHELNISVDQTSYTNIYVASAVSDKVNFIQTGWMVIFLLTVFFSSWMLRIS